MSELVTDCPRCGASKITFDYLSSHTFQRRWGWQGWYNVFCVCRNCNQAVVFTLSDNDPDTARTIGKSGLKDIVGSLNNYFNIEGFLSLKDFVRVTPPDYVPDNIKSAFNEGATCMEVNCFNAGSTMFRLCIDLATKGLLPEGDILDLNKHIRRTLGLRLKWLFDNWNVFIPSRNVSD